MQAPVKRGPDYPELSVGESTLDWEALAQDTLRKHQAVTEPKGKTASKRLLHALAAEPTLSNSNSETTFKLDSNNP